MTATCSKPVVKAGNPFASSNPHADPGKVPRHSAPASFLPPKAFLLALVVLLGGLMHGASASCVCDYDPTVDYFPNKLEQAYATLFSIEYRNSYKILTVTKADSSVETYYAYLCGTPVPGEATPETAIQIPIQSIAITTTTTIPLVEYLGERAALVFVSVPEDSMDSCVRKLSDEGKLAGGYSFSGAAITTANDTAGARFGSGLDVLLFDDFSNSAAEEVESVLGPSTPSLLTRASQEGHPLGRLEWTEFVAALLNEDKAALNVVTALEARYNCVKKLVEDFPPPTAIKVLWGSCSEYLGVWTCYPGYAPTYYSTMLADLAVEMVTSPSFSLNTTEFFDLVDQADVWIYTNNNWNESSAFSGPLFDGAVKTLYEGAAVVQNNKVFDIMGAHVSDWFENMPAEPDVLLMDLAQAIHGTRYIPSSRELFFLRNVFETPAASQAARLAAECPDETAPLYTGWREGVCTLASGIVDEGNPEKRLCGSGAVAGAHVSAGLVMVGSLVVAVMMMN